MIIPSWLVFPSGSAYPGLDNVVLEEVNIDNQGPGTSNVVATPNPVAVNTALTVTALTADTTTGGSPIAAAAYSIDGGGFIAMTAQDGRFDAVREPVTASLSGLSYAGVYEVCVKGTDAAGNVGAATCILLAVYDPTAGFVTGSG